MRSAHRSFIVLGVALVAALAMTNARTLGQVSGAAFNDFPNPFAGGGYGPQGWKLSVNGSMARRFRGVESIDDYVSRQRAIREDDSQRFAALVEPAQ